MLTLETTFSASDSTERDSSNIQPRKMTSTYFLIFNEPYEMFNLLKGAKKMDFVLFSPKSMLNFLSTNQSHMFEKFLISWCSINALCQKIRPCQQHKVGGHNLEPPPYYLRRVITKSVLQWVLGILWIFFFCYKVHILTVDDFLKDFRNS